MITYFSFFFMLVLIYMFDFLCCGPHILTSFRSEGYPWWRPTLKNKVGRVPLPKLGMTLIRVPTVLASRRMAGCHRSSLSTALEKRPTCVKHSVSSNRQPIRAADSTMECMILEKYEELIKHRRICL